MTFVAAAVQIAVGDDEADNRRKVVAWLKRAAAAGAQLVVFPEFCHLPPRFRHPAEAWPQALHPAHPFLAAVREAAAGAGVYAVVNGFEQGAAYPEILDTSYLLGPDGQLVGRYHKHLLFGPERNWITPGCDGYPVFATPLGRLGLYICMDGLIPEPARCLALQGAEVLVNSLNSAGADEPDLHIPVRALENGVWVVAANKVGAIAGGPAPAYIGHSMVVDPQGSVRAQADDQSETFILAAVDPAAVDRRRLSGRRPHAYRGLARPPAGVLRVGLDPGAPGDLLLGHPPVPGSWAVWREEQAVQVADAGGRVVARYRPLHPGPGDPLTVVPTPWGVLGLSGDDDLWYPEAARVLALEGADLLVHLGPWRRPLVLERAAENRVAVVVRGPEGAAAALPGPLHQVPHWRARVPTWVDDGSAAWPLACDLRWARRKGDQLAGRVPEDAAPLVEPNAGEWA